MKKRTLITILILSLLLYMLYKMQSRSKLGSEYNNPFQAPPRPADDPGGQEIALKSNYGATTNARTTDTCPETRFDPNLEFNGRDCSGTLLNENKVLRLGDSGCEVLLLQQRLNGLDNLNILAPNGKFCCKTRAKLLRVQGVDSMSLSQFQPDEQIGFNEFQGGTRVNNYSYMDITNK